MTAPSAGRTEYRADERVFRNGAENLDVRALDDRLRDAGHPVRLCEVHEFGGFDARRPDVWARDSHAMCQGDGAGAMGARRRDEDLDVDWLGHVLSDRGLTLRRQS